MSYLSGLDRLRLDSQISRLADGCIGYLCHNASVDRQFNHGINVVHQTYGPRLKALFGPQHGLYTDAQDNMIESPHFEHPELGIPVFSLYSEVRQPTPEMLDHIDTLIIDLQDVGTRVYTYIWTTVLAMKACANAGKKVIVLDRLNPLNGVTIEGNMSEDSFRSFVGLHPLPMRHGLTIAEVAHFARQFWGVDADLECVPCQGWSREQDILMAKVPWVMPSPNLASPDTLAVYPGFVLMEGTNLSEGRGTVRPFELFGHPRIHHNEWLETLQHVLDVNGLSHFRLRPHVYEPVFEKHEGKSCRGYQVHTVSDRFDTVAQLPTGAWQAAQFILRELYRLMGPDFEWRPPPFEYENHNMPIDILNGSDALRKWIEAGGSADDLHAIENRGRDEYLRMREEILLY